MVQCRWTPRKESSNLRKQSLPAPAVTVYQRTILITRRIGQCHKKYSHLWLPGFSPLSCKYGNETLQARLTPSLSSAFGLTSSTVGIADVVSEFNVSMPVAILGMSLYIFGIFFAPIHTPHWSERFGRKPVYFVGLFLCMLFVLGASRSRKFAALAACRFYAGFFGGPCLVLLEGTFADIWSADTTNTYYAFLASAAYIGTGLGMCRGILT